MPYEKEQLLQWMKRDFRDEADLQNSLRLLTELLFEHYGKQVIVLIDEYDVPLDNPDSRKRDDEFSPHLAELPEFY